MSVCALSSLMLAGDDVVFDAPGGAAWRLPVSALAVIGEFTAPGLEHGRYLAFVARSDDAWFQAPCSAIGAEDALAALAARLGGPLELRLADAAACSSRVMWPPPLREQPLLEFGGAGLPVRLASPVQLASSAMR